MATLTLREITVSELFAQAGELFQKHYEEIAHNRKLMQLNPDAECYQLLEERGIAFCVGAFVDDVLVGYSLNLVTSHLHYSDLLVGQNDALFVDPEHRRSRIGLELIDESERIAKSRGAKMMLWHAKDKTTLNSLLPKIGYSLHQILYAKEL